jgi:Stage II sporulation protein E (SpoIIE)
MSDAERAIDALLADSHLAAQYELPGLIAKHGRLLGAADALIYLVDLQQKTLVAFVGPSGPGIGRLLEPLAVEGTIAGRAYQRVAVMTQAGEGGTVRVWLPLLDGTDRLGVLAVTVAEADLEAVRDGLLGRRLRRFAALVAEVVVAKTAYGDDIVRLRRRAAMGLAAELQWSLLPPLTFAGHEVTVAGGLEPAYDVAGDTLDYAVDAGRARAAVFDAMGHGIRSAQLVAVAVAAYRNARRSGLSLLDTATAVHESLIEVFGGSMFITGLLADLDTTTGAVSWVNAGHPEPLLLRDGKLVKPLRCPPAAPLGLRLPSGSRGRQLSVCTEQLEPDDRVLLYTDGVTEARSPNGAFFGEERLADLITRNLAAGLPSPETMRRVVRALLDHQQGQLSDDATLLLLEWRSDNTSLLP